MLEIDLLTLWIQRLLAICQRQDIFAYKSFPPYFLFLLIYFGHIGFALDDWMYLPDTFGMFQDFYKVSKMKFKDHSVSTKN